MKLYYSPAACSLAPHIVANAVGEKLELVKVDLRTKKTSAGEDFYQINPNGYVPTLQFDDGGVLTEAQVICQYIADRKPEVGMMPKHGTMERYQAQRWLAFIATEIHKPMGSFFHKQPEEVEEATRSKLNKRLAYIDNWLMNQDYLMGGAFSAPDAYLWTVLNWAGLVKYDLSDFANIRNFQTVVGANPAVQQTLKEEGLVK